MIALIVAHSGEREEFPPSTRCVRASAYRSLEEASGGTGGITFEDIDPNDVASLEEVEEGAEVYFESGDCLDDSTAESVRDTAIWWRGRM